MAHLWLSFAESFVSQWLNLDCDKLKKIIQKELNLHNFKKQFGQNFISDKDLIDGIVRDAKISKDDVIIE